MAMIDLEAIRARNEARRAIETAGDCRVHSAIHSSCGSDCTGDDCRAPEIADIDALLAEVERLRAVIDRVDNDFGGMHVELRDAVGTVVTRTTLREHLNLR